MPGGGSHVAPVSSHPADRRRSDFRHDPDRPNGFLGADGLRHHGGLAVATALTLVFLPALYVTWFRIPEDTAPADAIVPVVTPV
jgi:hypothetical protein